LAVDTEGAEDKMYKWIWLALLGTGCLTEIGLTQEPEGALDDEVWEERDTYSGGTTTLYSRRTYDDYEEATLSMEHATARDHDVVGNDWDLLFDNGGPTEHDLFEVNMVTDDRSWIIDLGDISLDEVPANPDPDEYDRGYWGYHDAIEVHAGHLYVVRTMDDDTRQIALVGVKAHTLHQEVVLVWQVSPDPDRLVLTNP
jgi:hypothetical protein